MKTIRVNISWWWLSKCLIGVYWLFTCASLAQTVEIQDEKLRSFFCDNYKVAMNEQCTLLDTSVLNTTFTELQSLDLRGQNIENADVLVYFKNADTVYLRNNNLTSFPKDLRNWYPMYRLGLSYNQLEEAPTYLENDRNESVRLLYLHNNKIKKLPDEWNSVSNSTINVIDVSNNLLTEIPDLTKLNKIRRLTLTGNQLDFDDLIPLKNNPQYADTTSRFQLFPQQPFELSLQNTSFAIGESMNIILDNKQGGDSFFLLNNGQVVDSSMTGEFDLSFMKDDDFGNYSIRVHSEEFPNEGEFLESKTYEITRKPVQKKDVLIFSPNGDGIEDDFLVSGKGKAVFLDNQGLEVRTEKLPFRWLGDNKNGRIQPPGLYIIQKENGEYIEVLISY